MAQDGDDFLRRWSRRKRAAAAAAPADVPDAATPSVPLPSPDSLTFESDFKAFMQAKVEESVKRAALKKLFADPRFNVMDGLDIYIDDYSKDVPLPPDLLAKLEHSRSTLFGREEVKAEQEGKPEENPPEAPIEQTRKEGDGPAG